MHVSSSSYDILVSSSSLKMLHQSPVRYTHTHKHTHAHTLTHSLTHSLHTHRKYSLHSKCFLFPFFVTTHTSQVFLANIYSFPVTSQNFWHGERQPKKNIFTQTWPKWRESRQNEHGSRSPTKKYLHRKLFFTGGRNGGKVGKMSMEAGARRTQNRPSIGNRLIGKGIMKARQGVGSGGRGRGERGVRCEQCGERYVCVCVCVCVCV